MKAKKPVKFGKKSFLAFDPKKRSDYVTGFSQRKKERKEKAIIYNEAKVKKERREQRSMKRKEIGEMLEKYEEDQKEEDQWNNPDMDDDSDNGEEFNEVYQGASSSAVLSNEVTTKCGSATVEISSLGLSSHHFLGVNTDYESSKPGALALRTKYGHTLNKKGGKKDIASQSFSELVKGVMKKATKQAKINGDVVSFIDKRKFTSHKKRKKQMVTKL